MQVLGQNPNEAHDCVGDIKVFGPLNDAVDYKVKLPAEHLVQRLLLTRLGDGVPRQDQLSVGAFKHCEDSQHHGESVTKENYIHTALPCSPPEHQIQGLYRVFFFFFSKIQAQTSEQR